MELLGEDRTEKQPICRWVSPIASSTRPKFLSRESGWSEVLSPLHTVFSVSLWLMLLLLVLLLLLDLQEKEQSAKYKQFPCGHPLPMLPLCPGGRGLWQHPGPGLTAPGTTACQLQPGEGRQKCLCQLIKMFSVVVPGQVSTYFTPGDDCGHSYI